MQKRRWSQVGCGRGDGQRGHVHGSCWNILSNPCHAFAPGIISRLPVGSLADEQVWEGPGGHQNVPRTSLKIPRRSPEEMQRWLNHAGDTQTILTTSLAQAATFLPHLLSFIPPPSLPDPNLKPRWPYGGHGRWWPSPCPTLGRYLLGSRQSRLLQLVVAVLGVGADGHPCKRE